jgi:hypothetical protein
MSESQGYHIYVSTKRGLELLNFVFKLMRHVEGYSVTQYGDAPNDQVSSWSADQCVNQIGKYCARWNSNARGNAEKLRDLLKIAHYAAIAYWKFVEEQK